MLLEVKSLCRQYLREGKPFMAVDNASFNIDKGQFVSIIGASGSGKSTLLNMIAGIITPTSGDILLEGGSILGLGDREISSVRNGKIGFVPQGQTSLGNLTVLDNVCLPFYFEPRSGDPAARAMELLEKVGIGHLAYAYPRELSGGEQRRVAVARALINGPQLLLLDEPTSDLDPKTTAGILEMTADIARGGTAVLMVTHETCPGSRGFTCVYEMEGGVLRKSCEDE